MVRNLEEYGMQIDKIVPVYNSKKIESIEISPLKKVNSKQKRNVSFSIFYNNSHFSFHIRVCGKLIFLTANCLTIWPTGIDCYRIKKGEKISENYAVFVKEWNKAFGLKWDIRQILSFLDNLFKSYSKEN